MNPLVSIIMPAYNVAPWIAQAIQSVFDQSYENFELIVIDNNSTDTTSQIVKSYSDERLILISEAEQGLSAARNAGLRVMRGKYYCFLDADDILTINSLSSRIQWMEQNEDIDFVDGWIETKDESFNKTLRLWKPHYKGIPGHEMNKINPACYAAVSWLIRRREPIQFFDTSWKSLEDRIFFREIGKAGKYDFVDQVVYIIRRRQSSLMTDHRVMEDAFKKFLDDQKIQNDQPDEFLKTQYKIFHSIFMRTYLKAMKPGKAAHHFIQWLKA